jgi:Kdo2-lipid IVA lauroyltransferase/acyltransferase
VILRTRVPDEQIARAALARGTGLVVMAGHLGNWELGAASMAARGYPVAVIAKRAANPLFYRRILAARRRLGVEVIDFQDAARPTLRALRHGKIVAFATDQHAGRAGVWVPFFGRLASTYRGAALMALRTGAPTFLSIPLRMADGTYELRLEPIDSRGSGDTEADVVRVMTEYSRMLERAVRQNPTQYLWHHRRWRTPPAEIEEPWVHGAV